MIKVSIIVPVYNARSVMEKTIPCIINQTYKNIEIILVDNNSKDDSLDYMKDLQKTDKRIKVISEKKQGPNNARKAGINASQGQYIMFCDVDDYIKENAINDFVQEIEKHDADIVIGNYIEVTFNREYIQKKRGIFFDSNNDNLKGNKEILFVKPALWNKIFRKELIKEDFFIESTIGEDMVITIESIMAAKKIRYIDKDIYEYVVNENGLSNSVSLKNILDILITVEELKKLSEKYFKYEEYREEIEYLKFMHVIYRMLRTVMMISKAEQDEAYLTLKRYLDQNNEYKKNKYYKKSLPYRAANLILMNKSIYKLKLTQKILKQIFINKNLFKIFKKLDV